MLCHPKERSSSLLVMTVTAVFLKLFFQLIGVSYLMLSVNGMI
uniref:Uncharacterized protein n=1 Tax=Anguilla anguilla TaxID=7936 RepID=A0A0E9S7N8_ANGAN